MLSSTNFVHRMAAMPPNATWRHYRTASSLRDVPATDADREAFRRRLGLALAAGRSLTKWTQEGIAKELTVDRDTIGRWERGEREPTAFNLHWMATLYGVDADLFLNPPDSITELETRIGRLRRVAVEAARAVAEEEQRQRAVGGGAAPLDTRRPRTQPRRRQSRPSQ